MVIGDLENMGAQKDSIAQFIMIFVGFLRP